MGHGRVSGLLAKVVLMAFSGLRAMAVVRTVGKGCEDS